MGKQVDNRRLEAAAVVFYVLSQVASMLSAALDKYGELALTGGGRAAIREAVRLLDKARREMRGVDNGQ